MSIQEMLFLLIAGHFVADYVLQGDAIANGKNRVRELRDKPLYGVNWVYWMLSHAFTHSIVVYYITGSLILSLAELVLHFIIDSLKCEGKFGLHLDQTLHFACKIGYVVLIGLNIV